LGQLQRKLLGETDDAELGDAVGPIVLQANPACQGGDHHDGSTIATIARTTETHQLPDGSFREQLESFIPMGRQGDVSELASVVSFMCSKDASYVTGQTINVDGGARLD
jgi:NAD(P)-dependent dehydrogenase (short-subunit alcohol dehydrogenase family)